MSTLLLSALYFFIMNISGGTLAVLIFSMARRAQGNSAQKHRRDTFVPEVLNQIPAKEAGDYTELKELGRPYNEEPYLYSG